MSDPISPRDQIADQLTKDRHAHLAQVVRDGKEHDLNESDRAFLDAAILGTGFLVDGKRVDPMRVSVVTYKPSAFCSTGR